MSFSGYDTALEMRRLIENVAAGVVNKLRPRPRYGSVQSIDDENAKCSVLLVGDIEPVEVNMTAFRPTEIGQRVIVTGSSGDQYVSEVFGDPLVIPEAPALPTPIATVLTDYASLQAAIDATPAGGMLWIPEGTHSTTGATVAKPMTITGPGVLDMTSATAWVLFITSPNVTVRGLRIDGTGRTDGIAEPYAGLIKAQGISSAILDNVVIEDCYLTNSKFTAIELEWVRYGRVANNAIKTHTYGGIMLFSVRACTVVGNVIEEIYGYSNGYGIAVSDYVNATWARSEDVSIVGNTIIDVRAWEGIDTHGGIRISIVGNVLRKCKDGIALVAGNADRVTGPEDVSVVGNVIDRSIATSGGFGIRVTGGTAAAKRVTVAGNQVTGYTQQIQYGTIEAATITSDFERPQSGEHSIGAVGPGSFSNFNVYFNPDFIVPPNVTAFADSGRLYCAVRTTTSTYVNIEVYNPTTANSGTTTKIKWTAIPNHPAVTKSL